MTGTGDAPDSPPEVQVDHVSIAVPAIDAALAFFRRHFPLEMGWEKRPGYVSDFNWCDFYLGDFKLELIESARADSFVDRFLAKRGPGLHHWSLEAVGLAPLIARMQADGLRIVDIHDAGNGELTAFISPRSARGVLVQFWQVPRLSPSRPRGAVPYVLRSGATVRMKVDHLSLAVRDIEATLAFFRRYFPFRLRRPPHPGWDGTFLVASFYVNDYKVELIQNRAGTSGFVGRFIERRGEGMHHLSIDIDCLDPYVAQLEADGVRVVDKRDLDNGRKTAFISPRSAYGVLIQLWQTPEPR
jgi:catechol 2,3-dioxygenase-like lactoylglutathione lyase family enzyme